MGVQGLWPLLEPASRPVPDLDSLRGKRLAVDASIWLHQFIRAIHGPDGQPAKGAHVVGFFRRLCKLMHYRIKPVLVFDGGAPELKRRTLADRKKSRQNAERNAATIAGKLYNAQMELYKAGLADGDGESEPDPAALVALVKRRIEGGNRASRKDGIDEDLTLAPLQHAIGTLTAERTLHLQYQQQQQQLQQQQQQSEGTSALPEWLPARTLLDDRLALADELKEFVSENEHSLDLDSAAFKQLPLDVQHDIIVDMKLRSRQTSHNRLQQMIETSSTSMDFSAKQIDLLMKRNELMQRHLVVAGMGHLATGKWGNEAIKELLESNNNEMNERKDYSHGGRQRQKMMNMLKNAPKRRIVGERRAEFVLVKNDPKTDGSSSNPSFGAGYTFRSINVPQPTDEQTEQQKDKQQQQQQPEFSDYTGDDIDFLFDEIEQLAGVKTEQVSNNKDENSKSEEEEDDEEDDDDFEEVTLPESNPTSIAPAIPNSQSTPARKPVLQKRRKVIVDISDSEESDADLNEVYSTQPVISVAPSQPHSEQPPAVIPASLRPSAKRLTFESTLKPLATETQVAPAQVATTRVTTTRVAAPAVIEQSRPEPPMVLPASLINPHTGATASPRAILHSSATPALLSPPRPQLSSPQQSASLSRSPAPQPQPQQQHTPVISPDPVKITASSISPSGTVMESNINEVGDGNDVGDGIVEMILTWCESIGEDRLQQYPDVADIPANLISAIEESSDSSNTASLQQLIIKYSDTVAEFTASVIGDTGADSDLQELISGLGDLLQRISSFVGISPLDVAKSTSATLATGSASALGSTSAAGPASEFYKDAHIKTPSHSYTRNDENASTADLDSVRRQAQADVARLEQVQRQALKAIGDVSTQMTEEVQTLLRLCGIPYIVAPMEAEAQCAKLLQLGLVDGIVTDDSDVFLFGGDQVYRNLFHSKKHCEHYRATDLERELQFTRERLISLAQILGSDYTVGIRGAGAVLAMEILAVFGDSSAEDAEGGLKSFAEWWNRAFMPPGKVVDPKEIEEADAASSAAGEHATRRALRRALWTSAKALRLPEMFPLPAVRQAYLNPMVDDSKQRFEWGHPQVEALCGFMAQYAGFAYSKTQELINPIVQRLLNAESKGNDGGDRQPLVQTTLRTFLRPAGHSRHNKQLDENEDMDNYNNDDDENENGDPSPKLQQQQQQQQSAPDGLPLTSPSRLASRRVQRVVNLWIQQANEKAAAEIKMTKKSAAKQASKDDTDTDSGSSTSSDEDDDEGDAGPGGFMSTPKRPVPPRSATSATSATARGRGRGGRGRGASSSSTTTKPRAPHKK